MEKQSNRYSNLINNIDSIVQKAWGIEFSSILKKSDNNNSLSNHQKVAIYFILQKSDLTFEQVGDVLGGFSYFDVKEAKKWCLQNNLMNPLYEKLEEQYSVIKREKVNANCSTIREIKKSDPKRVTPNYFENGCLRLRKRFNYLTGYSEDNSYTQNGGISSIGLGFQNAKRVYS